MSTTPGNGSLDVGNEATKIRSISSLKIVHTLTKPTAKQVPNALPSHSIAHFACHGVSLSNPADSHLLLLKQSISSDGVHKDEEVDRLYVKDIAALKLQAAKIAYLSACNTGKISAEEVAGEVTHIVSAFHIAGFVHVIGALWKPGMRLATKWLRNSILVSA